jgi:hypothetical protein
MSEATLNKDDSNMDHTLAELWSEIVVSQASLKKVEIPKFKV